MIGKTRDKKSTFYKSERNDLYNLLILHRRTDVISVSNSERNCAHVSTFQTLVAQKIPKWRIFLCTGNKIQKLFPYKLNLFFRKI